MADVDSAMRLVEITAELTPALDAVSSAVTTRGGTFAIAIEVDGALLIRRSAKGRFDVCRRDADDPAEELIKALSAAVEALRSYQHGNSAPDLAEEVADHCASVLEGLRS